MAMAKVNAQATISNSMALVETSKPHEIPYVP